MLFWNAFQRKYNKLSNTLSIITLTCLHLIMAAVRRKAPSCLWTYLDLIFVWSWPWQIWSWLRCWFIFLCFPQGQKTSSTTAWSGMIAKLLKLLCSLTNFLENLIYTTIILLKRSFLPGNFQSMHSCKCYIDMHQPAKHYRRPRTSPHTPQDYNVSVFQ